MSRIPGWANVSSLALRVALFAGVALCALLAAPAGAAGVHYVKADATGAKNGLSWADAYTDLQAALAAAVSGDEIWVAQGTYRPTTGTLRTVSFVLREGVGLYGGFAGTETERGQRNWETNATILSGDIGRAGYALDNTFRVLVGADLAVLDGFTITEGNMTLGPPSISSGGGMYNENCSPTVANCTFTGNTAYAYKSGGAGGGMSNTNSSPAVTNCTFSGNRAGAGGGMYNGDSSPTVTKCTFSGNLGGGSYGRGGGGMYNYESSPTITNSTFSGNSGYDYGGGMYNKGGLQTVTNCTFSGNTASVFGGGMYNSYGSPTVTNCTFSGNTAGNGGGMANGGGLPTVTNCTFSGNTASWEGGGIYNDYHSSPTMTNCIIWGNSAPSGSEISSDRASTPTFSHCDIRGSGGSGASWDPALGADGGGNIAADPRFVDAATPAGPDGRPRTSDDGLRLQSNSPCIGAADPATAPRRDILGLPRKTAPDIGAYEFLPSGYCTVTYTAAAGGSISGMTPQAVAYGADAPEVTAVPDTGYRFVRWSDGSTANPRKDTNVTADITVTAVFVPSEPAAVQRWSLYG